MNKPPVADLSFIEESLHSVGSALTEAYDDAAEPPELRPATPSVLLESLQRLLSVLRYKESPQQEPEALETRDITALGNHGIRLLADLTAWSTALKQTGTTDVLRGLNYALAVWLARHEGEITDLQPVVDALAFVTNGLKSPIQLEELYQTAVDLQNAVDPALSQDLERSNPSRPWRLLVLNRATIAMRAHQPLLMESAFKNLTELLPEDSEQFFREGMEQMDTLDYPEKARLVMEKYYQLWCAPRHLH